MRMRMAVVCGAVLVTWLLVERALVGGPHALQLRYLAVGATTVILVAPLARDERLGRARNLKERPRVAG
jgi:hypothetical protein